MPTNALVFSLLLLLACNLTCHGAEDPVVEKSRWQREVPAVPLGVTPLRDPPLAPRQHIRDLHQATEQYSLEMGGTMDGPSTRSPRGYAAWTQVFQPMRAVRMENVGVWDVVNPRLTVNGKRQWWSDRDILAAALNTYGNPTRPADQARAIYEYYIRHRFHGSANSYENDDLVKAFNLFGYTLCNNDGWALRHLYQLAGFKVRDGQVVGHVVSEVFYADRWHLFDSDQSMIFLLPDNQTLAGNNDIAQDHDLVKRTHSYSINFPTDRRRDEFAASVYYQPNQLPATSRSRTRHRMDLTLRPGETLEWRFAPRPAVGHANPRLRKVYVHGTKVDMAQGPTAGLLTYNGCWRYAVPLRDAAARRVQAERNVVWGTEQNQPALRAATAAEPGEVRWRVAAPYVMVGGRGWLELADEGEVELAVSFDEGSTWQTVAPAPRSAAAPRTLQVDLDPLFPAEIPGLPRHEAARYAYLLRLRLSGAGVQSLTLENDLQMAPLSLPELELGANAITYQDQTTAPRHVRVTFDWVECAATRPPHAPAAPLSPADDSLVEGTQVRFQWSPAVDPDGDEIADYHFQLSDRPDLLWPLSPNFDKLCRLTADQPLNQYRLPVEGLLNPGQRYFWRVRALDARGVWGPWSATWSFTPQGPGVPQEVAGALNHQRQFTLTWRPNRAARPPTRYEIHASNERGFTVRHQARSVYVGNPAAASPFAGHMDQTFPPTLLQSVTGVSVTLAPEHAYYRVVAVDEQGNRSTASALVSGPRPFLIGGFDQPARVGQAYHHQVRSIAGLGDLQYRQAGAAYWDADQPRFALLEGPAWLTLDAQTGLLTGVPPAAGDYPVTLEVSLSTPARTDRCTFVLHVGR